MSTETYSGWTNYATWNCKLWMDNEQSSYEYWLQQAKFQLTPEGYEANRGRFGGVFDEQPERLAVAVLSKQLEESFDDDAQEWMSDQASFFADLFNNALAQVNWHEIAESLLESAKEA